MRTILTLRTFAVAAAAGSLLLTACGGTNSDESVSPSSAPQSSSEVVEPSDAGAPSDEASEQQESVAPEPSSTRSTVAAGPLDGDALNAVGVEWFGAFCSGIGELSQVGIPDTEGLSVAETADAVGTTYGNFGTGFGAAAEQLTGLESDMNFENANAFASEAIDSMEEVGSVYGAGAEKVKTGNYASEEDLIVDVRQIETDAVEAGAGDFGLSGLDESVFDAVGAQVPACAAS